MKLPEAGQEPALDLHGDSNVHGRGKSVVGALTSVDVIVGMDGRFRPQLSPKNLNGPEAPSERRTTTAVQWYLL